MFDGVLDDVFDLRDEKYPHGQCTRRLARDNTVSEREQKQYLDEWMLRVVARDSGVQIQKGGSDEVRIARKCS